MDNLQGSLNKTESKVNALVFCALIFFTFLLYITPNKYFPILGPLHLAKSSAIFAVSIYIFNVLRKKHPLLELDRETFLLLVIAFLAIVSIPFSIWPGGSFGAFKELYLKVIIICLLISNVVTSMKRLKVMLWSIIFLCSFISIIAIKNFITGNFEALNRIEGAGWNITGNPNDLALTLVLSIPFAMSFYLLYKNKLVKLGFAIYMLLATCGVICTFSRGGLITLLTAYTVFLLKNLRKSGVKVIIPVIFLLIIFLLFRPEGYTDRMSSIFDFSKDKTGSADNRKDLTIQGIKIMLDNPVFGVGLGMNSVALNEKGFFWEPVHNVYLQIGSDIGIPAMLIFILLLWKLIKNMHKIQKGSERLKDKSELSLLAKGIEICLISFAVAGIFYPVAYHFYFYYIAGLAMALKSMAYAKNYHIQNVTV